MGTVLPRPYHAYGGREDANGGPLPSSLAYSDWKQLAGSVGASCGHARAGQRREREGGANLGLRPRSLAFYLFASRWVSHLVTE